jgi:hypothetical protein
MTGSRLVSSLGYLGSMRWISTSLVVASVLAACSPREAVEPLPKPNAMPEVPIASAAEPASPSPVTSAAANAEPKRLTDDEPLHAGAVEFAGIVRPTKGGLRVRGVTFALETLQAALAPQERDQGYDDLVGAKLKVVAELVAESATERSRDFAVQSRGGQWFSARRLVSATIVAPAVMIEGRVGRSKGLYRVGERMVTRKDLAWSLREEDLEGKRVRLWGQPRDYVCPPHAQCLVEGVIPMFDVARAKLLP